MALTYRSFAKINVHLQIVGRRDDGYHELRTVFQTIEMHDRLTVAAGGSGVELEVDPPSVTAGPENLVHRAATEFVARWAPGGGVRIRLEKRIPIGGGLGGGSSNAATILLALRELWDAPASVEELWPMARALGADVPYFLLAGTALGVGRGDEVVPLAELAEDAVWLLVPPVAVSTAEVFASLAPARARPWSAAMLPALWSSRAPRLCEVPGENDLELPVRQRYPAVEAGYNALVASGAAPVRLSGSGSTLWACFPDGDAAARATRGLPPGFTLLQSRLLSRKSVAAQRIVS